DSDTTLRNYSIPLRCLAQAVLLSLQGHKSGYTFPLTEEDIERAHRLQDCLDTAAADSIAVFHEFVYPFLSRSIDSRGDDKWSSVIECFLALYSLTQDGTHKRATDMTQPLAMLEYHCRGATLYEAHRHQAEFGNDLYQSVTHYCLDNLHPGTLTPFTTLVDYQRFISSLAFSETNAPSITISDDATKFAYKGKLLQLGDLTHGVRRLFEDTHKMMSVLFRGHDIPVNIPDHVPDDMTNNNRDYSWLNNGVFTEPGILWKILTEDKALRLCLVDPSGVLMWSPGAMMEVMETCGQINKSLAVLCHVLAGQPARATEFVDLKIRNSTSPRGLFRD
ncbi:hypothetical protein GLOTRDRAFT_20971, partial [Gloeophyllum trabeum ATCC 11539]